MVEYIHYHLHPEQESSFLHACEQIERMLQTSGCCEGFELSRSADTAVKYMLRIVWSAANGCGHVSHSGRFLAGIRQYLSAAVDAGYYTPVGPRPNLAQQTFAWMQSAP